MSSVGGVAPAGPDDGPADAVRDDSGLDMPPARPPVRSDDAVSDDAGWPIPTASIELYPMDAGD